MELEMSRELEMEVGWNAQPVGMAESKQSTLQITGRPNYAFPLTQRENNIAYFLIRNSIV